MFRNFSRFIGLIALSGLFAVLTMIALSGPSDSSLLVKFNAIGARGKEVVTTKVVAAGKKIGGAVAHPFYEEVGTVNWQAGVARATGYGAMPPDALSPAHGQLLAKDAAQMDAERNLAVTLAAVKMNSKKRSERHVITRDEIDQSMRAKLKGSRVVDVRYQPDGTVEVDVEVTLKSGSDLSPSNPLFSPDE